jgi:molybdopterin molybdotransferase
MGCVGEIPVILLPGSPLDCLHAYDLFAGRLIRNLSGRAPSLPYRVRQGKLKRKIVSSVGTVELCRVLLIAGDVLPLGTADSGGLASVVRADGFIMVPATLEGYAPGATVDVYTYDERHEVEGS